MAAEMQFTEESQQQPSTPPGRKAKTTSMMTAPPGFRSWQFRIAERLGIPPNQVLDWLAKNFGDKDPKTLEKTLIDAKNIGQQATGATGIGSSIQQFVDTALQVHSLKMITSAIAPGNQNQQDGGNTDIATIMMLQTLRPEKTSMIEKVIEARIAGIDLGIGGNQNQNQGQPNQQMQDFLREMKEERAEERREYKELVNSLLKSKSDQETAQIYAGSMDRVNQTNAQMQGEFNEVMAKMTEAVAQIGQTKDIKSQVSQVVDMVNTLATIQDSFEQVLIKRGGLTKTQASEEYENLKANSPWASVVDVFIRRADEAFGPYLTQALRNAAVGAARNATAAQAGHALPPPTAGPPPPNAYRQPPPQPQPQPQYQYQSPDQLPDLEGTLTSNAEVPFVNFDAARAAMTEADEPTE